MSSQLMYNLKKWQLNSIRGIYVRTQTVSLPNGKEQEVTVFTGDKCIFLAQYTPLGTIAVHESVFTNKQLLNYVLTHEKAHKNQWWSFLRFPLALIVVSIIPLVSNLVLNAFDQAIKQYDWVQLAYFPFEIIAVLFLLSLPSAFSWLMEFDADFQAIKLIGLDSFTDLTVKNYQSCKLGLNAIINRVTHPPAELTICLWRWLHSGEGERA
jgi:Zn-dependent protease with chaperone function